MRNSDMPANPLVNINGHPFNSNEVNDFDSGPLTFGLTKREAAAIAAMAGICANSQFSPESLEHFKNAAEDAVKAADAVLKELEK